MNKSKVIPLVSLSILALSVSSCNLGIDPDAANSISAILAVLGEYLLAIISVILVFVCHLTRSLSFSLLLLGFLGMINAVTLPLSPYTVFAIGVLLFFSFFIPLKSYSPQVIIDKNVKKVFEKETKKGKPLWKDLAIDIGGGVVLLVIEYLFFAK